MEENKEFIWDALWDVKQTRKNYKFDYTIITDGYATSLRFLHKDYIEEEQQKKDKKKQGKKALHDLPKKKRKLIKKQRKHSKKNFQNYYKNNVKKPHLRK